MPDICSLYRRTAWSPADTRSEMMARTTTPAMKAIRNAETLDQLRDMLRGPTGEALTDQEWTDLPVFGGEAPHSTSEVWSWDATRLLVGTCAADLQIVERTDRRQ
jgi:hypothetical protein